MLYSAFLPGTGGLPFVAPFQGNVVFTNIAMTVDADGNAYFAANGSPGFPVTDGALETSGPVVAGKLDPTGTQLLYGTYLGGSEPGFGSSIGGIAVDSEGSVYLAGSANTGVFVAKLNPAGTAVVYRTDLGAGSYSHPMQVRVDAAGEAYVLGLVQGPGYPVTGGAFQTTYPLGGCSFLTKLSADGSTLVYSTFLSVTGAPPTGFDVDAAGTAYVGGQTGPGFPVSESAAQAAYGGGGDDVFIAQFTPDGRLGAATYLGGSSYESAFAVAAVSDGSIVVSGVTNSPDFPATGAATAGFFVARLTVAEPAAAGQ